MDVPADFNVMRFGRLVPPPKRYKIGELAAFTGMTRQTLHNYTRWGLIRETAWTRSLSGVVT